MILFDLDPNVVKPGWIPLLITIGLGLVMVLLYRSMRRQFRRVDDNFPEPTRPVGVVPREAAAEGDPADVTWRASDGDAEPVLPERSTTDPEERSRRA
jgi:hypothetical protein